MTDSNEERDISEAAVAPVPADDIVTMRREPMFNLPAIIVAFGGLCIAIHLVREFLLTDQQDLALLLRSAFIPARYTGGYQTEVFSFTTPVTYSLLHAGWVHLLVNMIWLAAFGSSVANRMGALRFTLFWALGAAASALLYFVLHSTSVAPLIGASGSISAMMGAAARFGYAIDRSSSTPHFTGPILPISEALRGPTLMILLSWVGINVAIGLASLFMSDQGGGIAWEAHIGGLIFGFLALPLFDPLRRTPSHA